MIKAVFYKKNGKFQGFRISGHAGYEDAGKDVVCASVSSAVMFAANYITDYLMTDADVSVGKVIELDLKQSSEAASDVIRALHDHIGFISEDYNGTISISDMEV